MLSLVLSYLVAATLSQTWIVCDKTGKMTIKNVIYQNQNVIQDLEIPANQKGKEFKLVIRDNQGTKDQTIGLYKTCDDTKMTLGFSKKDPLSAYTLEESIQKEHVKYNNIVIKPTYSYMISAHGGEYRNLQNRAQNTRQAWAPHLSTLWFFAPSYTTTPIAQGEEWTQWFESAKFDKLQKVAEKKGEIVSIFHRNYQGIRKQGNRVNQHYATYGPEFEISSGVYRMVRSTGRWRTEMIAQIPLRKNNQNRQMLVELFDIVNILEANFGPGQIYWNACREDKTKPGFGQSDYSNYPIMQFQPLVAVKNPVQLEKWRVIQRDKCIKKWHQYNKKDIAEYIKTKNEYAVGFLKDLQQQQNKEKWKKLTKEFVELMKKEAGSIKLPEFTAFNCERSIKALREKRNKMAEKIWNKYVAMYRKIEKSEQSSDEPQDLPGGGNLVFVADKEYSNAYYGQNENHPSSDQNAQFLDVDTIKISLVMIGVLLICLCFICFGGIISGGVFGYFIHGYIKNNEQKRQRYGQQQTDMEAQSN